MAFWHVWQIEDRGCLGASRVERIPVLVDILWVGLNWIFLNIVSWFKWHARCRMIVIRAGTKNRQWNSILGRNQVVLWWSVIVSWVLQLPVSRLCTSKVTRDRHHLVSFILDHWWESDMCFTRPLRPFGQMVLKLCSFSTERAYRGKQASIEMRLVEYIVVWWAYCECSGCTWYGGWYSE